MIQECLNGKTPKWSAKVLDYDTREKSTHKRNARPLWHLAINDAIDTCIALQGVNLHKHLQKHVYDLGNSVRL